jgi:hypothetical protein
MILREGGIRHIEDLPIDEFIDVLQNLSTMSGTEKMDGANLWLGIDEEGKLFTSREGKRQGADRMYQATDWPKVSAYNQFRAAHAALEQKQEDIKRCMRPCDMVEVEVLFGRQPNSVTYGANGRSYIAFLRGVNGTPDSIADHLGAALAKQEVKAQVDVLDTEDGETLNDVNSEFTFEFTTPQKIDPAKLKVPEVTKDVAKLEAFLRSASTVKGMTNKELMTVSLTSVHKDERAAVKTARAAVLARVQTEFKIPIKQALLDKVVRHLRSSLSDTELSDDEDIGIEGIVLRDPKTRNQVKVVDKDIFTTINKFNQSVRGEIQSSLNTVDPEADIQARGGLVGEMRIKIAEVLGNRDLARGASVRKAMTKFKGSTPEETIKNFAASMTGLNDYQEVKQQVMAIMVETAKLLKEKLEDFKKNQKNYRLKLKSGKELGLSPDTVKRTMLTFAESRRHLEDMFDKVKRTENLAQLLATMYGGQAKSLHAPDEITESLLEAKRADVNKADFNGKDAFQLMNTYLAIVLTAMLIYHENDKPGLRLLRDTAHYLMKTWSTDMSPVNHWGYVIWRNARPDMKKLLPPATQKQLHAGTKHVPAQWVRNLHQSLSWNKKTKMDWEEHRKALHRLLQMSGLRSERLNTLIDAIIDWPTLSYDAKVKAIGKLFMLSQQFATHSTLFVRLRIIQENLLLNATGLNTQMVEGKLLQTIARLIEDDAPGELVGQPVATTAAAIAPIPTRLGQGHVTLRRRNPKAVAKLTLKFPDTRKNQE